MITFRNSTVRLVSIIAAGWLICQSLLYVAYDRGWGHGFVEDNGLIVLLLPGVIVNDFLDDLRYTGPAPWSWVNAALILLVSTIVWSAVTLVIALPVQYLVRRARRGHAA